MLFFVKRVRAHDGADNATGLGGLALREPAIQSDLNSPPSLFHVQESIDFQEFAGERPTPIGERRKSSRPPRSTTGIARQVCSPGRDSEHVYTSLLILGIECHADLE